MMNIEQLRLSFLPISVKVLFVGESAPAGGTFFYLANSQVFRELRKAFSQRSDGLTEGNFLDWFKANGFYLDDLVLTPIDKVHPKERKLARTDGIAGLSSRIAFYAPDSIVAIAQSIRDEVKEAVRQSQTSANFYSVSFPGNGRQREFHEGMKDLLPRLLSKRT